MTDRPELPDHATPPATATLCSCDRLDVALLRARVLTDTGARHDLDAVIAELGFTRADLEAELAAEAATVAPARADQHFPGHAQP